MGIGWKGQTLLQMLENSERSLEETGYYCNIKELNLKKQDPFKYERSYAKLRGALVTARETALHVSASPIVKEIGELCFGLYTPEGDSIAVSTGIMVHIHTMSEAIKFMIRNNYEEKVGLKPGDIFLNNDPQCGNVHTTDVMTIIPIFWENELVGWAGGVTHQVDIGGIVPGHDLSASVQRFDDGVYYTCRKIGSEDKLWEDHLINARRSVRTPMYWELDERCRLSGCLLIRDAVQEFISKESPNYYREFMQEIIEEGRRIFKIRVKERLIPGRYRSISFSDSPLSREAWQPRAQKDYLVHQPVEVEVKEDGGLSIDFDGSSAAGPFPWNCDKGAMEGGQWVLLTQCLIHGDKVNDGAYYAVETNYPPGTWTNAEDPYLSYQCPWYNLIPGYGSMIRCISYALFSRGYREEVVAGYGMTADAPQGGGVYNEGPLAGERWALSTFEISGQGLGASAVRDGLDWGYAMWNPESDHGDIETWELIQGGIPYISRKLKPNLAGHGKYRGGASFETAALIYNSRDVDFFSINSGLSYWGPGICGGYPQPTGYRLYATDTGLKEIFNRQGDYPVGDDNPGEGDFEKMLPGKVTRKPYGTIYPITLENYDLAHWMMNGGPGYGDPLERKLENVKEDLNEGIYTHDVVVNVYGAVAYYDENKEEWMIDYQASQQQREKLRQEREEKSLSFKEFWQEERETLLKKELPEPVSRLYRESIELSYKNGGKWGQEFLEFWNLPEDWSPSKATEANEGGAL